MKILHVITSLRMGGAEKLMVDLLPRLQARDCDVELCVMDGTDTAFSRALSLQGIKIISLSKGGNVYNPIHILKLIHLIAGKKYDIIHTHNFASQLFGAFASIFKKCIFCTTEHNTSNRRRNHRCFAVLERWMYGRYHKVICISDKVELSLKNYLHHFSPPTTIVYNGIDTKRFFLASPGGINKSLSGCKTALIQIASFRKQKDQLTVINALRFLQDDVHVFFVGDGVLKDRCIDYAKEIGVYSRTHFLGISTDIPSLIMASDIVVMSSHWEGFGLAAVEGMAAAKPTIASDVDGLREVVNGAGLLFMKGDYKELAVLIEKLINNHDYHNKISQACFERARRYDITFMVEGYYNTYHQLLHNRVTK